MKKIKFDVVRSKNIITGETTDIPAISGTGGGSNVTMSDNPVAGVDLTVDGTTRVLAKESELADVNDTLLQLSADIKDGDIFKIDGNIYNTIAENKISNGYYYGPVGARRQKYTSDTYSAFTFKCKKNTDYTFTSGRFVLLLDAEDKIISVYQSLTTVNSANAESIAISFDHNYSPESKYKCGEGTVLPKDAVWTMPFLPNVKEFKAYANTKVCYSEANANRLTSYNAIYTNVLTNSRKNEIILFRGDIETFDAIEIRLCPLKNSASNPSNYVKVDNTNIIIKNYSNHSETIPHGLTIENNIQIEVIQTNKGNNIKVALTSNGKRFVTNEYYYSRYALGTACAVSIGSTFNKCRLTWTNRDINKSIWFFGDSYTAWDSGGLRWTYYLFEDGYMDNILLDGTSGGNSRGAFDSLSDIIKYGSPRKIVWAMGMNDGSDSDENTPSTTWSTYRDKFIELCTENNVEPIFVTIPTVPTISHIGKNKWIRNSGYRYIDVDLAVGASASGWYGSMLSSDGIHPSADGAKAIYYEIIQDFPEIIHN